MLGEVPYDARRKSAGVAHTQRHPQSRIIAAVLFEPAMVVDGFWSAGNPIKKSAQGFPDPESFELELKMDPKMYVPNPPIRLSK